MDRQSALFARQQGDRPNDLYRHRGCCHTLNNRFLKPTAFRYPLSILCVVALTVWLWPFFHDPPSPEDESPEVAHDDTLCQTTFDLPADHRMVHHAVGIADGVLRCY